MWSTSDRQTVALASPAPPSCDLPRQAASEAVELDELLGAMDPAEGAALSGTDPLQVPDIDLGQASAGQLTGTARPRTRGTGRHIRNLMAPLYRDPELAEADPEGVIVTRSPAGVRSSRLAILDGRQSVLAGMTTKLAAHAFHVPATSC